jgi:hypothetical protein
MKSLFVSESGECLPMSNINCRVLRSKCFLVLVTCSLQARRLSKWRHRYLTVSVCGKVDWLMYNGGLVLFRMVNVICADLVLLIFSRHLRVHCSIICKWACKFIEAMFGFEWVVMIAVSSAYVLSVVSGMSAAYIVYRNGPRILPWGIPHRIKTGGEVAYFVDCEHYL